MKKTHFESLACQSAYAYICTAHIDPIYLDAMQNFMRGRNIARLNKEGLLFSWPNIIPFPLVNWELITEKEFASVYMYRDVRRI